MSKRIKNIGRWWYPFFLLILIYNRYNSITKFRLQMLFLYMEVPWLATTVSPTFFLYFFITRHQSEHFHLNNPINWCLNSAKNIIKNRDALIFSLTGFSTAKKLSTSLGSLRGVNDDDILYSFIGMCVWRWWWVFEKPLVHELLHAFFFFVTASKYFAHTRYWRLTKIYLPGYSITCLH